MFNIASNKIPQWFEDWNYPCFPSIISCVNKAKIRISFTNNWDPNLLDIKVKKGMTQIWDNGRSLGNLSTGLLKHSFIILTWANTRRKNSKPLNNQVHLKAHGIYWPRKNAEENHKAKFSLWADIHQVAS